MSDGIGRVELKTLVEYLLEKSPMEATQGSRNNLWGWLNKALADEKVPLDLKKQLLTKAAEHQAALRIPEDADFYQAYVDISEGKKKVARVAPPKEMSKKEQRRAEYGNLRGAEIRAPGVEKDYPYGQSEEKQREWLRDRGGRRRHVSMSATDGGNIDIPERQAAITPERARILEGPQYQKALELEHARAIGKRKEQDLLRAIRQGEGLVGLTKGEVQEVNRNLRAALRQEIPPAVYARPEVYEELHEALKAGGKGGARVAMSGPMPPTVPPVAPGLAAFGGPGARHAYELPNAPAETTTRRPAVANAKSSLETAQEYTGQKAPRFPDKYKPPTVRQQAKDMGLPARTTSSALAAAKQQRGTQAATQLWRSIAEGRPVPVVTPQMNQLGIYDTAPLPTQWAAASGQSQSASTLNATESVAPPAGVPTNKTQSSLEAARGVPTAQQQARMTRAQMAIAAEANRRAEAQRLGQLFQGAQKQSASSGGSVPPKVPDQYRTEYPKGTALIHVPKTAAKTASDVVDKAAKEVGPGLWGRLRGMFGKGVKSVPGGAMGVLGTVGTTWLLTKLLSGGGDEQPQGPGPSPEQYDAVSSRLGGLLGADAATSSYYGSALARMTDRQGQLANTALLGRMLGIMANPTVDDYSQPVFNGQYAQRANPAMSALMSGNINLAPESMGLRNTYADMVEGFADATVRANMPQYGSIDQQLLARKIMGY